MAKPKMQVQYTPEQQEALRRVFEHLNAASDLARAAALHSLRWKVVQANKNSLELVYARKDDPKASPVKWVPAPEKPKAPLLARPTA